MSEPVFDHRCEGTSEAVWASALAGAPGLAAPGPDDRILVLAAHPDDETLGAGGLIARSGAAGADVLVVVATDGEASHPFSPTHSPGELAALRRREVRAAVSALNPRADVQLLGLPDGQLADRTDELVAALEPLMRRRSHVISPWAGDRHPDHAACARAAAAVGCRPGVRHWQYPIWAWHWARPDDPELPVARFRALALDDRSIAAKAAAIACHVSQHTPLSDAAGDEPVIGAGMLAHFRRPDEIFVVAAGDVVSGEYFDDLYARDGDPWGLHDRFYERRKRATLLAALTRPRFRRAFEPGCAIGLLTAELGRRCDEVVAWDIAGAAVEQARARLGEAANIEIAGHAIPDEWPDGSFDLIVLSEVGYYCADLSALVASVERSLAGDGVLVACHWRHAAPMHPHSAGAVHAALGAGRHLVVSHVEDDFLLQLWTRDGASVARAEGIVG